MPTLPLTASNIFHQNNGDVTRQYYEELSKCGASGLIAVALFRAQKRSTAAKKYRGRKFKSAAYDVKNWSMQQICNLLEVHAQSLGIIWGWKRDPNMPGYEWVLYVELPDFGQCSFHSESKLNGPNFPKDWDGERKSKERILAFCDSLFNHT